MKQKLQYFGHLMQEADSLEKTLMLGKIKGRRRGRQRMRWLDGITGHNSKASIFWCSAFFTVQLSHQHITTGKTIALIIETFVMFLLFNTLSRFVVAFLPRSKRLLISWLQSLSAVISELREIKPVTFNFSPFYLPLAYELNEIFGIVIWFFPYILVERQFLLNVYK